eukprot:2036348-Prymnesium_polylepis.2
MRPKLKSPCPQASGIVCKQEARELKKCSLELVVPVIRQRSVRVVHRARRVARHRREYPHVGAFG